MRLILLLTLLASTSNAADLQPAPPPDSSQGETITLTPSIRTIPIARTFRFEPQADITTEELAQLNPYLSGKPLYDEDLKALGTATRHLRVVK